MQSIENAASTYGKLGIALDVLINNAAIYPDENFDILTISREQLVKTFQTNTFAPLAVTQAFLPFLKKSGAARIINISSGYGEVDGLSHTVPSYCLSKLTLNGVTIMLDQALRSEGIAVYVMCPGWVRTDMGGANASRSVEEGADTAVWLAIDAPQSLSGKFFRRSQGHRMVRVGSLPHPLIVLVHRYRSRVFARCRSKSTALKERVPRVCLIVRVSLVGNRDI